MLTDFKHYLLGSLTALTLVTSFSLVWLADQYLLYDSINKGADPVKMVALKCGVVK